RLAVEHLFGLQRIGARHLVVPALVAEQGGRQCQPVRQYVPLGTQFDVDGGLGIDVAGGGVAGAVHRALRRRPAVGVGQVDTGGVDRLVDQAGTIGEQVLFVLEHAAHAGDRARL